MNPKECITDDVKNNDHIQIDSVGDSQSLVNLDFSDNFRTKKVFNTRAELVDWVRDVGRSVGTILVISKSDSSACLKGPRIRFGCERGGKHRVSKKGSEKEVQSRKKGSKRCECPFALKGIKMPYEDQWMVEVVCGFHNHPLVQCSEGHSYAGKLTEEERALVADMSKSGLKPKQVLAALKGRDKNNVSTMHTIYNARYHMKVAKISEIDCNRSQSSRGKGKAKQLRWEASMDNILIDTLMEEVRKGNKQGNTWEEAVWKSVSDVLFEKISITVERRHIESRLRTMKTEYIAFKELEGMNGFTWDPIRKMVSAPDDVWDDLLKKDPEKYKGFRNRGPKWDLDHLSIIIGNDYAPGSFAIGGMDSIDVDKIEGGHKENDLPIGDQDINIDGIEEEANVSSTSLGKRSLTSTSKRQHGKKTRNIDILQQMIEGMNEKIDQMTKALDLNTLVRTLYLELMKTNGFSKNYLESAYEILGRDVMGARMFLARDEESRKMVLEGLYEKIGDV